MKTFFFLVSLAFLFSCRRDNNQQNNNQTSGDYYVKYKANSQAIEYTGDYATQVPNGVYATRAIIAFGGNNSKQLNIAGLSGPNNGIVISIYADSVKSAQSYVISDVSTNGLVGVKINGKQFQTFSAAASSGYYLNVTILNHSGGWVSGTFSGKLGYQNGTSGTYEDLTITDGSFKTKVVY